MILYIKLINIIKINKLNYLFSKNIITINKIKIEKMTKYQIFNLIIKLIKIILKKNLKYIIKIKCNKKMFNIKQTK